MKLEAHTVLGLYSDASAVECAACLFQTDGLDILSEPVFIARSYSLDLRQEILSLAYPNDMLDSVQMERLDTAVTQFHLMVAEELLQQHPTLKPDVIGYSEHTIYHDAATRQHISLGQPQQIAQQLRVPCVARFSEVDLAAGGVGGPLLPVFWETLTRTRNKPLACVNLGGLTRLTSIGAFGELMAFEVGVGALLIDAWVMKRTLADMDFDGILGAQGRVDERVLARLLKHPYLAQPPPKTIDRAAFNDLLNQVEGLSAADGAVTLTAFVAQSIHQALRFLPQQPVELLLTGGGVQNPTLVRMIRNGLPMPVNLLDETPDTQRNLSAMGYGFLAARTLAGLPITFPTTTGVSQPLPGGTVFRP